MKKNNGDKNIRFFDERAESEVTGQVILLGLTILGISMITIYGVPAIMSMQDTLNAKNVEQAFTVFDSRASRTALAEAPMQITEINTKGGDISVLTNSSSQPSYITIELSNGSSIINSMTIPMGKIVYAHDDREVGYEGGGVWSKYHSKSVMISPPEFHYNGVTLTLPIVNISGSSSVGGEGRSSLNIEKKGDPTVIYPNSNYMNPIPENVTRIKITIKSEYYDAWGKYFESIPLTNVYPDANLKKVTVTLETPPLYTKYSYGALASDTITLDNNAAVDSYDSSLGSYMSTRTGNGSIRAQKLILLSQNAVVNGTAEANTISAGSGCTMANQKCKIMKDARGVSIDPIIYVGGTKYDNYDPKYFEFSLPDPKEKVKQKINEYKSSNDNGAAPTCISGNTINSASLTTTPCTIPGNKNYYLTTFDVPNNKILIFNTTTGPINIAVDSSIKVTNANITVSGTDPVKIYLQGGMEVTSNSVVNNNPTQNSSRFQITSSSSLPIKFENGNTIFVGSVYAKYAKISVNQGAQIFGAMVGDTFSVQQSEKIHYDQSLKNLDLDLGSGTIVMYLHITRNDVEVRLD